MFLRSTAHVDDIIGYHQCGFWSSRSTDNQIFFVHQVLEKKKWENNGTVHQLFIDVKKASDTGEKYCTILSLNFVYI